MLGPLLFLLYTAELFNIVAECGLTAHTYADDTQVYLSVPAAEASTAVQRFAVSGLQAFLYFPIIPIFSKPSYIFLYFNEIPIF